MAPDNPQSSDQTLSQILEALRSIAAAVNRGTNVIVDAAGEGPASQDQSSTIVDYLVLRELVGRQFDEVQRTVGATRFTDQVVAFDGKIPATATRVAVYTRRSAAPAEVAEITDVSGVDVVKKQSRGSGSGKDPILGFQLADVTDDQPIARLELRADDRAVALGPRLAAVA
jgi:hypothetical protein